MRRLIFHLGVACALTLGAMACDDDNSSPSGDGGAREGIARDGNPTLDGAGQNEGSPGDGVTPTDGPLDGAGDGTTPNPDMAIPEAGFIVTEAGVIKFYDGGVVITPDGGAPPYVCYITSCGGRPQACGDCIDNDGDGLIDSQDPECLGPCDNTEGPGLESGVGGTTGASCGVDCYFDYGNGSGNDDCTWDHRCDVLSPEAACAYDADFATDNKKCPAEQSTQCTDFCLPYTPNGCDCFGCCTFPALTGAGPNGADVYVWIGNMDDQNNSTCTLADITDPTKCPPCTPVNACLNTCDRCEICIGKPTVPADCYVTVQPDAGIPVSEAGIPLIDGSIPHNEAGVPTTEAGVPIDAGTTPPADGGGGVIINPWQCAPGVQPCGLPGQLPCPQTYYCISGCCKQAIL